MTFKEWFNHLSKESQDKIIYKNPWWFDKDSDTLFSSLKSDKIQSVLNDSPKNIIDHLGGYTTRDVGYLQFFTLLMKQSATGHSVVTNEELAEVMEYIVYHAEDKRKYLFISDINERKTAYLNALTQKYSSYSGSINHRLPFLDWLFVQSDYSKLDITTLRSFAEVLSELDTNDCSILVDIFGKETVLEYYKNNPKEYRINKNQVDEEFFDTLFFGENGWSAGERQLVIKNNYGSSMSDFIDFMSRVVSVEHSFLRCIKYKFIEPNPILATDVYALRKKASELTGNESVQQQFRFATDIRKLVKIAACCKRKSIGKTMIKSLGATGALLKMYSFDFDAIYNCLYPEDGEKVNWEMV